MRNELHTGSSGHPRTGRAPLAAHSTGMPEVAHRIPEAAPRIPEPHSHLRGAYRTGTDCRPSSPVLRPPRTLPPRARPQFEATRRRPPAMPHQIIRGEGPHNGDWLRNTMRLPPQEQQRRLEQDQHFRQLPQQRQEQLRNRLQNFNSMPPQQQQRVLNRMEMIEHLPPRAAAAGASICSVSSAAWTRSARR